MQHIVKSLPRAGTLRAARLLAEIGDARGRFPTAEALACLAGVAPSTRQSGKTKAVTYRWAADKELRDALCDFAGDCRRANRWAEDLYQRARARGHDHPHAVRILGRAWANIIWPRLSSAGTRSRGPGSQVFGPSRFPTTTSAGWSTTPTR